MDIGNINIDISAVTRTSSDHDYLQMLRCNTFFLLLASQQEKQTNH